MFLSLILIVYLEFARSENEFNDTGFYQSEKYLNYSKKTERLYEELFTKRNYNKYLSPIYEEDDENATEDDRPPVMEVHFVLEYLQMFGLDAQSQLLSACVQLQSSWIDPRLSWDPNDFGGIKNLYLNTDIVWIPDNQFGNVKTLDDMVPGAGKALKISHDGIVRMINLFYTEISCQINITTFPFDKQVCEMPLMSFSYDRTIMITNGSINQETVGSKMAIVGNGEWKATGIDQICIPFGSQQIFLLLLNLKRVPNYYINVIAIPCFIITLLSIIGMFWTQNFESEQIGKLGIGLTSLVSMTVLLDLLSTSIPKTEVFPLLGIYVVVSVGIIGIACILIMVCSTKDPLRKSVSEMKKQLEAEKSLPRNERIWKKIREKTFHRHILFQVILHAANTIGFIVFLSFWK